MEFLIILLLILLNGAFSISEISVISSRKARLEVEAKKGNKSAQRVLSVAEKPEGFLSTIQIGITLIGLLTGMYSGDTLANDLAKWFQHWPWLAPYSLPVAKAIVVICITYLTLVLGELFPKRLGMSAAERTAKIVVGPMEVLSKLVAPFVWLLSASTRLLMALFHVKTVDDKVTEEEIKAIIQEGTEDGEIEEVEQDIVERVFKLSDRNVGSIMTYRNDLVVLDVNDSNEQLLDLIKKNLFNVYPVVEGELDNLLGVVFLKDLFGRVDQADFSLKDLVRPALYLPENQNVYAALEQIRNNRVKYGLVIDEFGQIQGIVTLKDILTALLGSMPEAGEEQEIVERAEGGWLVDGQCSFFDFLAHFDLEDWYSEQNYNTISGLIFEELEHVPSEGELLEWKGFRFEIIDMDGARIDKILVTKD